MSSEHCQLLANGLKGVIQAATRKRRVRVTMKPKAAEDPAAPVADDGSVAKSMFVPIIKAEQELQIVTGVVLQPEVVDAQGDIMSAEVIREAAHKFLARYNRNTKLKLQHKVYKVGRFDLVESYIAPMDMVIGDKTIKAGSWIMSVKVNEAAIWKQIKDGKITGFSIGGRAKVQQLAA